jgi:hypothetical protein
MIVGEVEYLDLEELQGISGLKGLRIEVNLEVENNNNHTAPVELSQLTSNELLKK